jgi:hypothetical protein
MYIDDFFTQRLHCNRRANAELKVYAKAAIIDELESTLNVTETTSGHFRGEGYKKKRPPTIKLVAMKHTERFSIFYQKKFFS